MIFLKSASNDTCKYNSDKNFIWHTADSPRKVFHVVRHFLSTSKISDLNDRKMKDLWILWITWSIPVQSSLSLSLTFETTSPLVPFIHVNLDAISLRPVYLPKIFSNSIGWNNKLNAALSFRSDILYYVF